jgi:sugar lactone lactonase YvrE
VDFSALGDLPHRRIGAAGPAVPTPIEGFIMQLRRRLLSAAAIAGLIASPLLVASPASAHDTWDGRGEPEAELLVDDLGGGNGSTIGPDGALYVAVGTEGTIVRVDPRNGHTRTFAEDLPLPAGPYGGVVDVVFRGHTAYALVSLVDKEVGGDSQNGIYRIDDRDDHTLIANLSKFNRKHLPEVYDLKSGNPFAIEAIDKGFLVTDGNHNRLLKVSKHGHVRELVAFDNVVPTGLEVTHKKIYVAQAGPVPHNPEDGRVISLKRWNLHEREVASGYPLLVDVEKGKCGRLYALSNGQHQEDAGPAMPAEPDTGALLRVRGNGTLSVVVDELDRPTSVEFIHNTAFVTTLDGEIWRVEHVGGRCQDGH